MDKAIGSKIADYIIKPVNPNQVLLSIKKNVHSQQLVTEQTTADYRAEFGRISLMCQTASSFEQWCAIYRKITGWELKAIIDKAILNFYMIIIPNNSITSLFNYLFFSSDYPIFFNPVFCFVFKYIRYPVPDFSFTNNVIFKKYEFFCFFKSFFKTFKKVFAR